MVGGGSRVIRERYRLDRELGRSAGASTWLATDLKAAQPCVLKRLREVDAPPADARLFEAQAGVLARLDHPGIPRLVEYFVEGEGEAREQFLVTRYHPGENLERLAAKERPLTEPQAVALLRRLAAVLSYLHGFDPPLLHRAIKAANIIVGPDGRPCLTDFHFATEGPGWKAWKETAPDGDGIVLAAPEAVLGAPVPASDIYALGMAIVLAMSGRDPAELPRDAGRPRIRDAVRASEAFLAVLTRMVEPSLERRYPDARTLEADLARLGTVRASGIPPLPAPAPPLPAPPVPRRFPTPAGVEELREEAPTAGRSGASPRLALIVPIVLIAALAVGSLFWSRGVKRRELPSESLLVQPTPTPAAPIVPVAPEPSPAAPLPAADPQPATEAASEPAPAIPTAPAAAPPPAPAAGFEPAPVPVSATAAGAPVPPPVAAPGGAPAVAEGRLLFDGEPVTRITKLRPVFWFRNVEKNAAEKPEVDYADGVFSVRGLPPGRMGVSARIDLEPSNPGLYPGDLDGYAAFTVVEGSPAAVEVPLRKVIRLLQPVDNGAAIAGWEAPCGSGSVHPERLAFSWEPVDAEARYDITVDRLACGRGYAPAGRVFAAGITETWVDVELPPSAEGECYSFRLSARKAGRPIGIMITHGRKGVGWDYRFTVK